MVLKIPNFIFVFLKLALHIGSALPIIWLYFAIPTDKLGGDPVQGLTHFLGLGAIRLLLLSLCITPIAKQFKLGKLLRLRRPLGLWCFAYATLHFAVWIVLDIQFYWGLIGEEIIKRNYLLIGFLAWLILLPLAITSIPTFQRVMKGYWKKLHNWIYLVALLAPIHFFWSVKSEMIEPCIYLVIALGLLVFRHKTLLKYFRK
ncbi:MAG: protein-methionine-sulfoxide reductase heme-binding subunit MsrQ [Cellvibrionaceae bacterium]